MDATNESVGWFVAPITSVDHNGKLSIGSVGCPCAWKLFSVVVYPTDFPHFHLHPDNLHKLWVCFHEFTQFKTSESVVDFSYRMKDFYGERIL